MIAALGFWAFLLSAMAVFVIVGGMTERIFILLLLACTIGTMFSWDAKGEGGLPLITFSIDLALWFLGVFLVVSTDKFWPVWFTGFHTNAVALQIAAFIASQHYAMFLEYAAAAFAIPALGVATFGVLKDYRSVENARSS